MAFPDPPQRPGPASGSLLPCAGPRPHLPRPLAPRPPLACRQSPPVRGGPAPSTSPPRKYTTGHPGSPSWPPTSPWPPIWPRSSSSVPTAPQTDSTETSTSLWPSWPSRLPAGPGPLASLCPLVRPGPPAPPSSASTDPWTWEHMIIPQCGNHTHSVEPTPTFHLHGIHFPILWPTAHGPRPAAHGPRPTAHCPRPASIYSLTTH